jgi:class 3 adenylate cyclase
VDPRTDLYAVGILMFEMLTGVLPFDSERTIDVYLGHLKSRVPRLKEVAPDLSVPPGVQELLDRLLSKSVADRIQDAASFRRALRGLVGTKQRSSGLRRTSVTAHLTGQCSETFELVAAVEPKRTPGLGELMQEWALEVAQHGGQVREREPGLMVASFVDSPNAEAPLRAALAMKQLIRNVRLRTLRPLYVRIGIHEKPSLAARLCEEAPRGGVVIGADCVEDNLSAADGARLRLESAGEVRVRGHRGLVKMLQVITTR